MMTKKSMMTMTMLIVVAVRLVQVGMSRVQLFKPVYVAPPTGKYVNKGLVHVNRDIQHELNQLEKTKKKRLSVLLNRD